MFIVFSGCYNFVLWFLSLLDKQFLTEVAMGLDHCMHIFGTLSYVVGSSEREVQLSVSKEVQFLASSKHFLYINEAFFT